MQAWSQVLRKKSVDVTCAKKAGFAKLKELQFLGIRVFDATKENLKDVVIFTDGGAKPNPGRGGYGVVLRFGRHKKELSEGYELTTNNRMELMAVIVGLEALKTRCRVKLYSDSKYIISAMEKGSAFRWRSNNWAINVSKTKFAKNPDLWDRLLKVYDKHDVKFLWVKGHSGIPDNERCDQLASAAIEKAELLVDVEYQSAEAVAPEAPEELELRPEASKTKISEVGQPCRKCNTPVIKKVPKKKTLGSKQTYYFTWYLYCTKCKTMYMVEEAKREVADDGERLFDE